MALYLILKENRTYIVEIHTEIFMDEVIQMVGNSLQNNWWRKWMGVSGKLATGCWLELSAGTGGIHYAILSIFVLCSKFSIMKKIKMGIDNASSVTY